MTPAELVVRWREQAQAYDRDGVTVAARLLARVADELEEVMTAEADTTLTLADAARESGYTTDHLRREIRVGHIPNAGRRNAPRIRRADLPVKAARLIPVSRDTTSPVQIARSVVHARPTAR
jgi:hypothetical protein